MADSKVSKTNPQSDGGADPQEVQRLRDKLERAEQTIKDLSDELDESNRGLVAISLELEDRVDERTAELRAANQKLEEAINAEMEAQEALNRELYVNRSMLKLGHQMVTTTDLAELAEGFLETAKELTSSEHGYVSVIDPVTKNNIGYTLTGMMGNQCLIEGQKQHIVFPCGEDGVYSQLWGHCLNTLEPFFTNSPSEHRSHQGAIPAGHIPIERFLAAPAVSGGELLGQIALANPKADFNQYDLSLISSLADRWAIAIERYRAQENLIKEKEQAQKYLDIAGTVLVALDADEAVTMINKAGCKLLGYGEKEILGRNWFDSFIPTSQREIVRGAFQELLVGEIARAEFIENGVLCHDGRERLITWHKTLIRDADGNIIGTLSSGEDITEKRLAEAELLEYRENLEKMVAQRTIQLQAANKELESFAYSVSHDLRAPLRALDGFSFALLEDYQGRLDEGGQDYLNRIRAASQRMGDLIDAILSLSKVTRSEMNFASVDLSNMANEVFRRLSEGDPRRASEMVIAPDLFVEGDEPLIRALLENLIRNAWKFSKKQPVTRIELGIVTQSNDKSGDGNQSKVYFIKDNGAGFDPQYMEKLFQPFQRLHNPSEFPGTGIGLATVQRIVSRHGGTIWAESSPDQGATFYFTIGTSKE